MSHHENYVEAAVERELAILSGTGQGGRAQQAFASAAALGSLVVAGALDYDWVHDALLDAALSTGLSEREARGHVERGLRKGMERPRTLPDDDAPAWRPLRAPVRRAAPRAEPEPPRYPRDAGAFWASCGPVTEDDEVAGWQRDVRGIDPAEVELWDLARALPRGVALPRWAWSRAGSWAASGHRCILPLFDAAGRLVSLRARDVTQRAEVKSLAPSGFSARGAVLACPLGIQLLARADLSWWTPEVLILEGEPDFLLWASTQAEGDEQGPAIFGVTGGAWTSEHAARVPDGARVIVRTHSDSTGDDYARRIVRTFRNRAIEPVRGLCGEVA